MGCRTCVMYVEGVAESFIFGQEALLFERT